MIGPIINGESFLGAETNTGMHLYCQYRFFHFPYCFLNNWKISGKELEIEKYSRKMIFIVLNLVFPLFSSKNSCES